MTDRAEKPNASDSAGIPIAELVGRAATALERAGVPSPQVDAELIAAHILGKSRGQVQLAGYTGGVFTQADAEAFAHLVARRVSREPLQHITGTAPFRHLTLAVGKGVFVPRPETEEVAQLAINALQADASTEPIAVDLCSGSGAIALALATEVPHARVWAVEVSPEALVYTRRNAEGVENLTVVEGDFTTALPELEGTVAVVISNPPYVPRDAIPRDEEVRRFDPELALYSGVDGLDAIRALSVRARQLLRAGGTLVIEHGDEQGAAVREILATDGWQNPQTHRDLTGRDRATTAVL